MTEERRPLRDWWTTVGGVPICTRIGLPPPTPTAPALVLVHGYGVSSRYMVPTAERLASTCAVYAPDLPGSGRSGNPRRALTLPELADALAAWMDALEVDRAAFLGNSMGCQTIVELALRHPRRIDRAVLVAPVIDPRARTALQQGWRLFQDMFRERPSETLITLRDYRRFGVRRGWRTYRAMMREPMEAKLPLVTIPTLVVRGERDPIVPQRWAEEVARLLPRGQLVVIPGAAHAVNYDAPAALTRVVLPFLLEGPHSTTNRVSRPLHDQSNLEPP